MAQGASLRAAFEHAFPTKAVDAKGNKRAGFIPGYSPVVNGTMASLLGAYDAFANVTNNTVGGALAPTINFLSTGATRMPEPVVPVIAPGTTVQPDFSFGAAAPKPAAAPTPTDMMTQLAALGVVTSGLRTPEHNAEVGGVPDSQHTKGTAADLVPKPGQTMDQLLAQVQAAMGGKGRAFFEGPAQGHKPHIHAQWGDSGNPTMGVASPTLAPDVPGVMPGVGYLDPAAAMAMMSAAAPQMNARVKLPDAPQMAAAPDRPTMDTIDKAGMLAQLQAFMPPEDDTSTDPWDRVKAGLMNMALAASRTDRNAGLGAMIAAMGGSFAGGAQAKGESQKAETKAAEEARRQFGLMLGKMGIDVDLENLKTGNQNKGINWESANDKVQTGNKNLLTADQRMVQQLQANAEIDQSNVGAVNSFNARRAGVGIDAMGGQVAAQNAANQGQVSLNNRVDRPGTQDAYVPGAKEILASVGIGEKAPAKELETAPDTYRARQAANYIAANNIEGVVTMLGDELIKKVELGEDLPDELFTKDEWKIVAAAAKKDGTGPAALRNAVMTQLGKPGKAMAMAKARAAKGSPLGKMIIQHNKAK